MGGGAVARPARSSHTDPVSTAQPSATRSTAIDWAHAARPSPAAYPSVSNKRVQTVEPTVASTAEKASSRHRRLDRSGIVCMTCRGFSLPSPGRFYRPCAADSAAAVRDRKTAWPHRASRCRRGRN